MAADELVRIQQAHHLRLLGVQNATADLVGEAWDTFGGLDDLAAAEFEAAATVIVDTAKAQTSTLATAYMQANDRAGGFPAAGLKPTIPTIRGGVPTPEVYHRSVVEARVLISKGAPYEQASAAARSRATGTARTDVSLVNRAAVDAGAALRPWIVGYRRVLTGASCAFCATASTQRYRSADLLPLHPRCDCDIGEIIGKEDPGRVINQGLLDEIKAAGKEDGRPDYWNGPYIVDESGAVRYKKIETVTGDDGKALLGPDGNPLRRTVAGEKVRPDVVEHGEMGPMLTSGRTAAPPASGPARPSTAPSAPGPARSRAKPSDPDVLSEASRRNVSPERVVEIREEKAQRRFLEERARRAAEKAISADSPEVRAVAERFGVHPDEVLSARARVADVRKVAREDAARVQAEAIAELQRLDAVKLKNPPRIGAKTDLGTAARRGEYDWLGQVSDREKARLSREWYDVDGSKPDQMALQMSARLGRDLDVDEAMDLWMELNRRAEAAGAMRRGKLPSAEAYSGQIDTSTLLPRMVDEGYDAQVLFGDDLAAAGHIAEVEARLVADDALQYLAEAANPIEGPSPYRMSFQAWEDEVRDLEHEVREGLADEVQRRRYAELVPQYLDEPGLDFENLYARIVSTARKAGEEIPEHARIPWQ